METVSQRLEVLKRKREELAEATGRKPGKEVETSRREGEKRSNAAEGSRGKSRGTKSGKALSKRDFIGSFKSISAGSAGEVSDRFASVRSGGKRQRCEGQVMDCNMEV